MRKKIFIDCGTNLCQGLSFFINKFEIDESWEVYSFEANPNSFDVIDKKKFGFVKFENKAVWIYDGVIELNVESYPLFINDKKISVRKDAKFNELVGGATNIMGDNNIFNKNNPNMSRVEVQCFDFSKFLINNFEKDDFIIIKMDIEGAEYQVLEKMVTDESIKFVNEIYVEFHNHLLVTKFDEMKLKKQIDSLGVKLIEWI